MGTSHQLFRVCLEMTKKEYDKYMQGDGVLEAVGRTAKKKYTEFAKFKVAEVEPIKREAGKEAAKILDAKQIRINAHKSNIANAAGSGMTKQDFSDQGIMDFLNSTAGLASWINVGLTTANIAVTVAGFVIISKKLDDLSTKIDELSSELADVKKFTENVTLEKYDRLKAKAKTIFGDEVNGRSHDRGEIYNVIEDYRVFINSFINAAKEKPSEKIYVFLADMMPIYADLIVVFYRKYYDDYKKDKTKRVPIHTEWMTPFDETISTEYQDTIYDYYFRVKRLHSKQAYDILIANMLMTCNLIQSINDTLLLLDTFGGVKEYEMFVQFQDQKAKEYVDEKIIPNASEEEKEEIVGMMAGLTNQEYAMA